MVLSRLQNKKVSVHPSLYSCSLPCNLVAPFHCLWWHALTNAMSLLALSPLPLHATGMHKPLQWPQKRMGSMWSRPPKAIWSRQLNQRCMSKPSRDCLEQLNPANLWEKKMFIVECWIWGMVCYLALLMATGNWYIAYNRISVKSVLYFLSLPLSNTQSHLSLGSPL